MRQASPNSGSFSLIRIITYDHRIRESLQKTSHRILRKSSLRSVIHDDKTEWAAFKHLYQFRMFLDHQTFPAFLWVITRQDKVDRLLFTRESLRPMKRLWKIQCQLLPYDLKPDQHTRKCFQRIRNNIHFPDITGKYICRGKGCQNKTENE